MMTSARVAMRRVHVRCGPSKGMLLMIARARGKVLGVRVSAAPPVPAFCACVTGL